jgi:hypothetical protein
VASMTTSVIQVSDRKLRERKILNFQYQNLPTEENIELEDSENIIKIVFVFTLLQRYRPSDRNTDY